VTPQTSQASSIGYVVGTIALSGLGKAHISIKRSVIINRLMTPEV
jgi:hypothetical protein